MPDHNQLATRAKEIVEFSALESKDKQILLDRLPYCETNILAMFVEVCDQDPFSIDALVKNLKRKLDAQGNLSKLHAIVQEEREEIERILEESKT